MPRKLVLYEMADPAFLKLFGWLLSDIQTYHCREEVCQELATRYLYDLANGLGGFYCLAHATTQMLKRAS